MQNELDQYRDILAAARAKRFREWEPKIRLLAETINSGRMRLPRDPILRASILSMRETAHGIDMTTIDSNVRMLASAVWDSAHPKS